MQVSGRAADLAADVLGAAGVGHPNYAMGMADYQAGRRRTGAASGDVAGPSTPADDTAGEAPTPPPPPTSPDPPTGGGGSNGPRPGGGTPNVPLGGGGAGGGPAEAGPAPEVPA
jgi:hypothetical protein